MRVRLQLRAWLFVLAAAASALGVAHAEAAKIRSDGLYWSGFVSGSGSRAYAYYLRFYEDGKVVSVTSTGAPDKVIRWFDRNRGYSEGAFRVEADRITFVTRSKSGAVEYKGSVGERKLSLNVHSRINGHRSVREFVFVSFDDIRDGRYDRNPVRTKAATRRGPANAPALSPGKQSQSDALIRAVRARNDAQALALLKQGADPNARDPSKGVPALYLAAQSGRLAVVDALLAAGANVDASPSTLPGATALGVAAQRGDRRIVQSLIASAAKVDAASPNGVTPLLLAAQYGHTEVVALLLGAGAAVNGQRRNDGMTALAFAAERGFEPMLRLLIERGARLELGDRRGLTPLHHAVRKGRYANVQALLEAHADIEAPTRKSKLRPLHAASYKRDAKMVRMLLAAGAEPNAPAIYGITPMHVAVGGGAIAAARELIGVADLEAKAKGETPLDVARKRRDAAMIKLLTEAASGKRP